MATPSTGQLTLTSLNGSRLMGRHSRYRSTTSCPWFALESRIFPSLSLSAAMISSAYRSSVISSLRSRVFTLLKSKGVANVFSPSLSEGQPESQLVAEPARLPIEDNTPACVSESTKPASDDVLIKEEVDTGEGDTHKNEFGSFGNADSASFEDSKKETENDCSRTKY